MSTDEYSGTGSQTDFTVTFPYLSRDFVEVRVDAVLQTNGVDYTYFSGTVIRFTPAPISGTNNIEFRRVTSTDPLVDFVNGAGLDEADLDVAFQQSLHLAEETQRDSVAGITIVGGNWDGDSRRITNLAPPISDTDAATKASVGVQVDAAAASAAQAANSGIYAFSQANLAAGHAVTASDEAAASAVSAGEAAQAAVDAQTSIGDHFEVTGLSTYDIPVAFTSTSYSAVKAQLPLRTSAGNASVSNVAEVIVPVPSGTGGRYQLCISNYKPVTSNVPLYMTFSVDGGTTYLAGTTYQYVLSGQDSNTGNAFGTSNGGAFIQIHGQQNNTVLSPYMSFDFLPANGAGTRTGIIGEGIGFGTFAVLCTQRNFVSGSNSSTIRPTHIKLAYSSGNISEMTTCFYSVVN